METKIVSYIKAAETTANLILSEVGNHPFTIADVKKKLVKQNNNVNIKNPKHIQSMSWSEAKAYVDYIIQYGFCEALESTSMPTLYIIRLDIEFRKKVYETKKAELEGRLKEINIVLGLIDTEHLKHAPKPKKAAKKTVKKAS
ncbi:MAG: hypothetical protein K8R85_00665 [Bacteroidetes bacterium]|nr:hypothetical protein [Bacteroidota bacterium]